MQHESMTPAGGIRNCTCHSIREGSGGLTYSYAIIGVECPACEQLTREYEQAAEWEAMSDAERIQLRWRGAVYQMPHRRPGAPGAPGLPPF